LHPLLTLSEVVRLVSIWAVTIPIAAGLLFGTRSWLGPGVADLLHLDIVAQYQVLSYQPTHLSSLVDETNMARECRNRGYDLANHAALQNKPGPRITRHQIPTDWIWDRFSLEEADQDGIQVELFCAACRYAFRIGAGWFRTIQRPPSRLKAVKKDAMWKAEPCSQCGELGRRSLSLLLS
jgi:hypothetical protein